MKHPWLFDGDENPAWMQAIELTLVAWGLMIESPLQWMFEALTAKDVY